LSSVASEVLSKSGRRMLEALIAGQRDPAVLAEMALGKMRIKRAALGEALAGHFAPHHAVTVRQVLDHVDFLDTTITVVSEHVATRMEPFAAATRLLVGIPDGVPSRGLGDYVRSPVAVWFRFGVRPATLARRFRRRDRRRRRRRCSGVRRRSFRR
jgi:hypothetical protein